LPATWVICETPLTFAFWPPVALAFGLAPLPERVGHDGERAPRDGGGAVRQVPLRQQVHYDAGNDVAGNPFAALRCEDSVVDRLQFDGGDVFKNRSCRRLGSMRDPACCETQRATDSD
jgi:hypothetical protein